MSDRRKIIPREDNMPQEKQISEVDLTDVDMGNKNPAYWKGVALALWKDGKYWKRRFLNEHQTNFSKNLMHEELDNEFKGLLRKKSVEVPKIVHEEVMTLFSAHKDIQEVVKEVQPRSWFKITRNIVLLTLGALVIIGAMVNDKFRQTLNDNAVWIAVVAVAAVIAYLYYDRKNSK
jgi:hypothetical protein